MVVVGLEAAIKDLNTNPKDLDFCMVMEDGRAPRAVLVGVGFRG